MILTFFIQIVPPPMAPPPPPGLPINTGLIFLMALGVIYGLLILRKRSIYAHKDSYSIYDYKLLQLKKSKIYNIMFQRKTFK